MGPLIVMLLLAVAALFAAYFGFKTIAIKYLKRDDGPELRKQTILFIVIVPLAIGTFGVVRNMASKPPAMNAQQIAALEIARNEARIAEENAKKISDAAAAKVAAANQKRESKHGKAPVPSGWDGSVREVEQYLKASAKDPDSLKFERWSSVSYNSQVGWLVLVDWRAKNSFGGYVREINWFSISNGRVKKHDANAFQ